jgi:hypothetical protein
MCLRASRSIRQKTCSLIITDMLLNNNMQYGGLIKKNTNFNFTYTITN